MQSAIQAHGDRYVSRVYTDDEQRDCGSDPRRLARRFAAKEATMKALKRTNEPIPWRSIGVRMSGGGQPTIELTGPAAELARRRSVVGISVTLAGDDHVASALVMAECAR